MSKSRLRHWRATKVASRTSIVLLCYLLLTLGLCLKAFSEEQTIPLNLQSSNSQGGNVLQTESQEVFNQKSNDPHANTFAKTEYVSAKECGTCHPEHFKEWSVSPHAYAQLSPVFDAMHRTLVKQTNGTLSDFCIRCHTVVGLDKGEAAVMSNLDRDPVALEGVSCVTCHRRKMPLGKASGRITLEQGDIFAPVYGPFEGDELQRVINSKDFSTNTERGTQGRNIHVQAVKFEQISTSAFCGTCHDVNNPGGLRLEEAFSEYKSSPAAAKKESCQDCHMSKEPGLPSGFEHKPVAIVGGKPTKNRKRTNHMFVGPDYSIVHPGIFPHNVTASDFATKREWLAFDYKKGWGTDEFEFMIEPDYDFPERWSDPADRYEARLLLDQNLELLEKSSNERKKLLQRGYQLGEIEVLKAEREKIAFHVEFKNGTDGHNVPTGFDAERLVFLRVNVKDSSGKTIFRSGDLDPNGDLRDSHSIYVHNGERKIDPFLFSLQSRFLVNMIKGGDREQILPINYSTSPLPFVRPPRQSTLLVGRPRATRKHRKTIPPLASRWAKYELGESELKDSQPPYTAKVQIVTGMVPVNLIYEIQYVGFDYNMSPRDVADAVVAGHQVLWEREVSIAVKGDA